MIVANRSTVAFTSKAITVVKQAARPAPKWRRVKNNKRQLPRRKAPFTIFMKRTESESCIKSAMIQG